MNQIEVAEFINNAVKVVGILFAAGVSITYMYGLRKLGNLEKEIFDQQDQIDNIEQDQESKRILHSGMINQNQFERMTEKRRKPMEAKLNKLKMKRQFLLDKLPLISWLRK